MIRLIFVVFTAVALVGCSSSQTYNAVKSGQENSKPLFAKAVECEQMAASKHAEHLSNFPKNTDPQYSQKTSSTTPITQNFIAMDIASHRDLDKCFELRYAASVTQHFLYGPVVRNLRERRTSAVSDLINGNFKTVGDYAQRRLEITSLFRREANVVWENLKLQIAQEKTQSRESFAEGMRSLGSGLEAFDKQQKEMMRSQNPTLICRKAGGYAPGTVICQ